MALFLSATALLYIMFRKLQHQNYFVIYVLIMLPVVLFFLYWMMKVWKDESEANFKNSLRMNVISMLCTTTYFIILIVLNH